MGDNLYHYWSCISYSGRDVLTWIIFCVELGFKVPRIFFLILGSAGCHDQQNGKWSQLSERNRSTPNPFWSEPRTPNPWTRSKVIPNPLSDCWIFHYHVNWDGVAKEKREAKENKWQVGRGERQPEEVHPDERVPTGPNVHQHHRQGLTWIRLWTVTYRSTTINGPKTWDSTFFTLQLLAIVVI